MSRKIWIILLFVCLLHGGGTEAMASVEGDCGCDYVIPASQWLTDAQDVGIEPGDLVCLEAGIRGGMYLRNFAGTAENPIVVQNCGGKTIIEEPSNSGYGIFIGQSQHLRLTGTGDTNSTYGIVVKGPNMDEGPVFGIRVNGLSSNIEVDHTEVYNVGFAGIEAKTDPTCDPATWRENFTMYDVSLHDNYVHDTVDGEGFYVGFTFYDGYDVTCEGQPVTVYGHVIEGLQLYNNIIENTGAEGIQVGSTPIGAEIFNNEIRLYGQRPFANYQNNGMQIGSGTGGKVYNNWIQEGAGNGLIILTGIADNQFYNNVIIDAGANAIFIDERGTVMGDGFSFINNTIINPVEDGIVIYTEQVTYNDVKNNIIVNSDGNYVRTLNSSVPLDMSHNLTVPTTGEAGFADASQYNYQLHPASPAIDMGMDASGYGVTHDFTGLARPAGEGYDAGAYEYPSEPPSFDFVLWLPMIQQP